MEQEEKQNNNSVLCIKDIILIVLTAICTTFCNQLFYRYNGAQQMKLEIEKDFVLRQYPLYNRVKLLKENFSVETLNGIFPTRKFTKRVKADALKNVKEVEAVIDSVVNNDSIRLRAPKFIFSDDNYDLFVENLKYIKLNVENIEPEIYISAKKLLDFIEKYPLPQKEKRIQEIYLSGWGRKDVYGEFQIYLDELYNQYLNRMVKYGIH